MSEPNESDLERARKWWNAMIGVASLDTERLAALIASVREEEREKRDVEWCSLVWPANPEAAPAVGPVEAVPPIKEGAVLAVKYAEEEARLEGEKAGRHLSCLEREEMSRKCDLFGNLEPESSEPTPAQEKWATPLGHAFYGGMVDDKCQEWVSHGDIGCKRRCGFSRASHVACHHPIGAAACALHYGHAGPHCPALVTCPTCASQGQPPHTRAAGATPDVAGPVLAVQDLGEMATEWIKAEAPCLVFEDGSLYQGDLETLTALLERVREEAERKGYDLGMASLHENVSRARAAHAEGHETGREEERAAVVKWLRKIQSYHERAGQCADQLTLACAKQWADHVERGEHHKKEKE